ncbi:MAG: hypothetical protein QOF51_3172, partial [Chloroflexota bacterium]|nr:hypothetical protein [Chloroflexota bacterium]
MAKTRTVFVCQACSARFPRWMGQCTTCGQWNSLQEAVESRSVAQRERPRLAAGLTLRKVGDIELEEYPRLKAGVSEWDRVLGGGIVPGSVVLVGGDPGVGKSTLLLQVADAVARGAAPPGRQGSGAVDRDRVWYISGEESLPQIGLRARRLGLDPNAVSLSSATDVHSIIEAADENPPEVLIVDSIQSVYDPAIDSTPGSVTQLRECTLRLHQFAKERHVAVLLVGHVTKEGVIAGPKTLEHMVDAVLYLEGERLQAYRLLRSVKNRFGATSEVGVFEMQDRGLAEVPNPSAAFLSDRVEGG